MIRPTVGPHAGQVFDFALQRYVMPIHVIAQNGSDIQSELNAQTVGTIGAGQSKQTSGDVIAYRTSGNCGVMEQGDKTAALNTATDPNQNIVMLRSLAPEGLTLQWMVELLLAYAEATSTSADSILSLLQRIADSKALPRREDGSDVPLHAAEILQPAVLRQRHSGEQSHLNIQTDERKKSRAAPEASGSVRNMRQGEGPRRASQRRKHEQQFSVELAACLSRLPQPHSPQTESVLNLWQTPEGARLLQQALHAFQEMGRPIENEGQSIRSGQARIRIESVAKMHGLRNESPRARILSELLHATQAGGNAQGERISGVSQRTMVRRLTPL